MITVVFQRGDDGFRSVRVEGHAGHRKPDGLVGLFFPKGYGNLLCASVSTLLYQFKVNVAHVSGIPLAEETRDSGYVRYAVNGKDELRAKVFFEGLYVMLKSLERQHLNKIKIITEENHVS